MRAFTLLRVLVVLTSATTLVGLGCPPAWAQDDDLITKGAAPNGAAAPSEPTKDPYEMHDSGAPSPGAMELINDGSSSNQNIEGRNGRAAFPEPP